jgi:type IV secretory pathway VirB3-like protein
MINNKILEAKLTKPNSFFGVTIQKGNLNIIFNYYPALLEHYIEVFAVFVFLLMLGFDMLP